MQFELVYALPSEQKRYALEAQENTTVATAIELSGVLQDYPELVLSHLTVGIWGKRVSLDDLVSSGDRVEIYRPLLIDPKQSRQLQVKIARKGRKRSFYPPKRGQLK